MLHNLAATLNTFDDVGKIGESITAELRTIIDYHNCRVYLLEPNGHTLTPVAFRGELFDEYGQETLDELVTEMGEGMTGWVAEHRTSLLTPNAQEVDVRGPDRGHRRHPRVDAAVPMLVGEQVVGVIVLSSLGYGKFDEEDQRLLEVLAAHAAVAFENAKLLGAEREAAATSAALLELSQTLTGRQTIGDILQDAVESVPSLVPAAVVAAYVRDVETGGFRVARVHEIEARHASGPARWSPTCPGGRRVVPEGQRDPFIDPPRCWSSRSPRSSGSLG